MKKLSIFLAVLMILGTLAVLASCGTPDKDTDTSTQTTEKKDNTEPEHKHIKEIIPAVAPTCTETGFTEGEKCSECGEVLVEQEIIPAGHKFKNNYRCIVCGETLTISEGLYYELSEDASWKSQFSLRSQRRALPKNVQTTAQLYSSHMLVK